MSIRVFWFLLILTHVAQAAETAGSFYKITFDPQIWQPVIQQRNEEADLEFVHYSKDAYALIISERVPFSLSALKTAALENFQARGQNVQVLQEETQLLNGELFLVMDIGFSYMGAAMQYRGYYWAGQQGILQAITYTGKNLFSLYQKDFNTLMAGLKISS